MKLSTTLIFLISIISALAVPLADPGKKPVRKYSGTPSTVDKSHTGSVEELEDRRMEDDSMFESPQEHLDEAKKNINQELPKKKKKKDSKYTN
jgi:hypothetical protein